MPHETLGEVVVTCVVPHDGRSLEAREIRTFLRERLASYKVPRAVWLRREDELPQKSSGKVDKAALRAEAARLTADARLTVETRRA